MVVVANTHVRNHGIASGEMILDNMERLASTTRGLEASSMSADDRGSSANRTLSAFSRSLGLGDFNGIVYVCRG